MTIKYIPSLEEMKFLIKAFEGNLQEGIPQYHQDYWFRSTLREALEGSNENFFFSMESGPFKHRYTIHYRMPKESVRLLKLLSFTP